MEESSKMTSEWSLGRIVDFLKDFALLDVARSILQPVAILLYRHVESTRFFAGAALPEKNHGSGVHHLLVGFHGLATSGTCYPRSHNLFKKCRHDVFKVNPSTRS